MDINERPGETTMKSFCKIMVVPALLLAGGLLLSGGHTFAGPVALVSAFGYSIVTLMS